MTSLKLASLPATADCFDVSKLPLPQEASFLIPLDKTTRRLPHTASPIKRASPPPRYRSLICPFYPNSKT